MQETLWLLYAVLMDAIDLNLLGALDALLAEGSVIRAARRLGLSPSAMSRTLTRLRHATGDPLLVRSGRGLVPTPHAAALRERVHLLSLEAQSVLQPSRSKLDLSALDLTFTIRAGEWFMDMLSGAVVAKITASAPRVRLCFVPKHDVDPDILRDGSVDLEIGKLSTAAPEVRTHFLFRDRYVGVCRKGHPLLAGEEITPKRYAAYDHVASTQVGGFNGLVDIALSEHDLSRVVRVVVPGFPDALRLAATSDLLALVPRASLVNALGGDRTAPLRLEQFEIPVSMPEILVSAMWHPRLDADPAHRWLRQTVISICKKAHPPSDLVRQ